VFNFIVRLTRNIIYFEQFLFLITYFSLKMNHEIDRDLLLKEARKALENAYSKYSKFKVGAALLTKEGEIYTGCNIENLSYGLTICAERVAFFKAVSENKRNFVAIAITSSGNEPTFPCGACRQVLSEFHQNIEIFVDKDPKTYRISELIPYSFSEKSLGN